MIPRLKIIQGAQIAVDYKRSLWRMDESSPEYLNALHNVHARSAYKLLYLCQKQGGIYVKLGQHISSLDYLLPEEYCSAMTVLHDEAMFRSFEEIVAVFHEEFGCHPDELFDSFERRPVAAASLAQVHRATKGGKEYAVKVD